ncbi:MAG: OmpA family protein [Bacteroidales bacterium]
MKKFFTGILATGLLFAISGTAYAQTEVVQEEVIVIKEKPRWVTNGFWDNMYIGIGGGAQVFFGENSTRMDFKDRVSPEISLEVGKWVAPGWGWRIKANGWQLKSGGQPGEPYTSGSMLDNGLVKQKWNYYNLHGDFMFDLMSIFGTYDPHRVYSLIPYFGVGYTYSQKNDSGWKRGYYNIAGNFGLINRFRVSDAVDINLELQGTLAADKLNGVAYGKTADGILGATLGVTYKFKQRDFQQYDAMCPVALALMNDQVNQLRGQLAACEQQNSQLASALAACKAQKPTVQQIIETGELPFTSVLFVINKAVVRPDQMLNLANAAEMMKKNPDKTYTVVGYADKETGTADYNLALSEKRANAVAKILTDEFGVNPSQLKVSWDGSSVQPFGKEAWNRVVIVEQAK